MTRLALLFGLAAVAAEVLAPRGCSYDEGSSKESRIGFDAQFWEYPFLSTIGYDEDYPTVGYMSNGKSGNTTMVMNQNYKFEPRSHKATKGSIYSLDVWITNYGLELTGYFRPRQGGNVRFIKDPGVDSFIQLGAGSSDCEFQDPFKDMTADISFNTVKNRRVGEVTYLLQPNKVYPLRILNFTPFAPKELAFKVQYDDDTFDVDIGESIFHPVDYQPAPSKPSHILGTTEYENGTVCTWSGIFGKSVDTEGQTLTTTTIYERGCQ